MTLDVLNPVDVERKIREISDRIANSAEVCNARYKAYLTAERAYDQAYAHAYLDSSDAPAHTRKYEAEVATAKERETRDVADAAYKYADRLAKALESELRAYQSVGASVRQMYAVAGTGER